MARTAPRTKPRARKEKNPLASDPLTRVIKGHERRFKKKLKKLKSSMASAEAQITKRSEAIARQQPTPLDQQTNMFEKQIAGYEATLETAKELEVTSAAAIERLEIIVKAQAEKLEELEARLAAQDRDLAPFPTQDKKTDDMDATFGTDPGDTWIKKSHSKGTMKPEQAGREIELAYRGVQDKT